MDVLITFAHLSWQKGSAAQVVSFVREFRKLYPDTRFALLSQYADLDCPLAHAHDIEVVGYPMTPGTSPTRQNMRWLSRLLMLMTSCLLRKIRITLPFLTNNGVARAFQGADLIADLSGDSYRDRPGGFSPAHNLVVLTAALAGRPIVLVSQSIGPFRTLAQPLARFALNRARCIYVREKQTLNLLRRIGVKPELVVLGPDIAFALPLPEEADRLRLWHEATADSQPSTRAWVGISMSCLMMELRGHGTGYLAAMGALANHIHDSYGASLLLVPHVINAPELGPDDRVACRSLARALGEPAWVSVVDRDLGPSELKGLIGYCEVLVAARMHAGIAALSSGVPTLMLSWSHKYRGLMGELDLQQHVWEMETQSPEDLIAQFDDLWRERTEIRRRLGDYRRSAIEQIARVLVTLTRPSSNRGAAS